MLSFFNADVILTALKPQLKSTTAEDVANSLYYFHLNTEEDARFMSDEHSMRGDEEDHLEVVQKPFPRKPLPDTARSSFDFNRQMSAVPEPLSISFTNRKLERKALGSEMQKTVMSPVKAESEEFQKKPLGPRSIFSESSVSRKPLPDADTLHLSSGSLMQGTTFSNEVLGDSGLSVSSPSISPVPKKSFSITVIRRDASSGAQWNIGTVFGESHDQEPKSPSSKKSYFDISVHLTAPGYTRFRDSQTNSHHQATPQQLSYDQHSLAPEAGFDRQIRMEGISFWDRSKQHKRAQSDMPGMHKTTRGRSGSTASPELDGFTADPIQTHDSGAKGYVFTSPWGGRCKFATSSSGRSLKCKHTLPGPVSSSNMSDSSSSQVIVSELRFNLPSLAMFQSPLSPTLGSRENDSRHFHIPKFSHIRSRLSPDKPRPPLPPRPHAASNGPMYPSDDERPPLPPRPHSNFHDEPSDDDDNIREGSDRLHPFLHNARSSSDEGDGRLDLTLGQEMAGGGNRGKRVKLGKLIIMDEGSKMLDLIVAANMGIWWSVWESTT
jgi:hypothetical protein